VSNGTLLLEAQTVRKEFGGLVAVNDVDFAIPEGRIVGLIGPNGAGKTTLFNVLTGVYKPTSGEVFFHGLHMRLVIVHMGCRFAHQILRRQARAV